MLFQSRNKKVHHNTKRVHPNKIGVTDQKHARNAYKKLI